MLFNEIVNTGLNIPTLKNQKRNLDGCHFWGVEYAHLLLIFFQIIYSENILYSIVIEMALNQKKKSHITHISYEAQYQRIQLKYFTV